MSFHGSRRLPLVALLGLTAFGACGRVSHEAPRSSGSAGTPTTSGRALGGEASDVGGTGGDLAGAAGVMPAGGADDVPSEAAGAAGQAAQGPLRVTELSAGDSHTCARLSDGSLKCWGDGAEGDLGYGESGTIGDDELPSSVGSVSVTSTPGVGVAQVVAGYFWTGAVLTDGSLQCWGYDNAGQLGNGQQFSDIAKPPSAFDAVSVTTQPGVTVRQLAAGMHHACAVLSDGSVSCWGQNIQGELGYGDRHDHATQLPSALGPVSVTQVKGLTVQQLTAGGDHACALLSNGAVVCWGVGPLGYLNGGPVGDDETPSAMGFVRVTDTPGVKVTQLSAGLYHQCALLSDGSVKCWGANQFGQLGYANTDIVGDDELPASVGVVSVTNKPGVKVTQLAAGWYHTCALLSDGSLKCWGNNDDGQLGYGNTENIGDDELPSSLDRISVTSEPDVTVSQVAAGGYHTCVLLSDDSVKCWGDGDAGQLGYGNKENVGDDELPSSVGSVSVF